MSNLLFDRISRKYYALITTIVLISTISNSDFAIAKPLKVNTATTFDFKGCTKTVSGQDIVCVGIFKNRDADKSLSLFRGTNTFITDFNGTNYIPDEIKVTNFSCRSYCNYQPLTLVEGVDYKVLFIFKDVFLPSPKIALFQVDFSIDYSYGKVQYRRIDVKVE